MKVLYVAFHDPENIDVGNAMDYFHYHSICDRGFEVKVLGPFNFSPSPIEEIIARLYRRTGKRYLKFTLSAAWKSSHALNQAVREWKPDIIFTIYTAALVFYRETCPAVYSLDTSIYGLEKYWPLYGWPALMISKWEEQRVFNHCRMVLTNSEWHRKLLQDVYKVPEGRTQVFALPSTLPPESVPESLDLQSKKLTKPLRLLLVGRNYRRKGIDTAIEVVHQLNSAGIPSELTVCGVQGQADAFVHFVGPYKKNNPDELKQYLDLYRKAHLLIHPALFEPAGIVAAEAAAFGTPTITNNVGGLGTTVADGESGIVLPGGSPADAYVHTIMNLIRNPQTYYTLCTRTRQRYERELNWDAVGEWFSNIFLDIARQG